MAQGGSYPAFGLEYTSNFTTNALGPLTSVLIADGMTRTVSFTNDETRPSNAPSEHSGSPHEVYYRYAGKQMAFTGH